jgi:hypothetical protein
MKCPECAKDTFTRNDDTEHCSCGWWAPIEPQGTQLQGATVWSAWEAVCEEAEAIVIRGEKFLLLDEEMTFRMGDAMQHAEKADGGCYHWCKACTAEWKDKAGR